MGFMDFLFGGSQQKQTPGTSGYVSAITDWANQLGGGLDYEGRQARKRLKHWNAGEYDTDPVLSADFAPIRDMYATSEREGERAAAMGVGAKWGQDQPAIASRVTQLNEERAREAEGQAMSRMIPALKAEDQSAYEASAGRNLAEEGLKMQGLNEALQGWLASFYQKQTGGLIPALAGAASGVGGMLTGIGNLRKNP